MQYISYRRRSGTPRPTATCRLRFVLQRVSCSTNQLGRRAQAHNGVEVCCLPVEDPRNLRCLRIDLHVRQSDVVMQKGKLSDEMPMGTIRRGSAMGYRYVHEGR